MGTLQDTVSDPGERGTQGVPGDRWPRAGGPFCPGAFGVRCAWECLGFRLSGGVGDPLPCVPLPRWPWEPQELGCVFHPAARPRGGCAGKEGAPSAPPAGPSSEPPTLLAPTAHFGEMEAASQYVGGKTLGPSCSCAFEHTQIWGEGDLRGVLPLLRLSIRLDGSLTCVPMVLGVRSVALVPLGVQLLGGLGGFRGRWLQDRSEDAEIQAGKRREGNAVWEIVESC